MSNNTFSELQRIQDLLKKISILHYDGERLASGKIVTVDQSTANDQLAAIIIEARNMSGVAPDDLASAVQSVRPAEQDLYLQLDDDLAPMLLSAVHIYSACNPDDRAPQTPGCHELAIGIESSPYHGAWLSAHQIIDLGEKINRTNPEGELRLHQEEINTLLSALWFIATDVQAQKEQYLNPDRAREAFVDIAHRAGMLPTIQAHYLFRNEALELSKAGRRGLML